MKKVSVIVPVYNVEDYLEKCLDSLVNQTLKDIEIIVVNDGSPDNSQKIIDKYVKKYPDLVKGFIKENGGLSDARNYGIKKAKGEYIALVDSDDYVAKDFLEKMYSKALNKDLDIVVCDTVHVFPNGKEITISSNLKLSDDEVKNYLLAPSTGCIRLYKKYLFDNNQFKKGILYEDLELTPGLINETKKVGFVEEGLYYYLQRDGSIMKQKEFNKKLLDIFEVLSTNKKKLKNYKEELEYLYITHLLRSATLRFLDYNDTDEYLARINEEIKNNFPNFKNNIYFQKSSNKLKLICTLAYNEHYKILKIMKKLSGK